MDKQPWIGRPFVDIVFILLPPFLSLLVIAMFPGLFGENASMPDAGWVILVLLIDVAHVYSTLYRTYFDPSALTKQRFLLWTIPFAGFVAGVLLYSIDGLLFWRLLAYVAVFHFVRQQYGFMRVYSRREPRKTLAARLDTIAVYYATLYPILYWHLKGPRNFNWFVEGDFVFLQAAWLLPVATALYVLVVVAWLAKDIYFFISHRYVNIPKIAIIAGTLLSWYFGIVYFNGDMAFTLLNVVSHGIPYMALVWIYGEKNYRKQGMGNGFLRLVFSRYGLAVFLGLIFLFAFVEEGLWDIALWKEHKTIFGTSGIPAFNLSHQALSFIVPLLALPQVTHYILDGFIWKVRDNEFKWSSEVKA
jgi:hypothetical protein